MVKKHSCALSFTDGCGKKSVNMVSLSMTSRLHALQNGDFFPDPFPIGPSKCDGVVIRSVHMSGEVERAAVCCSSALEQILGRKKKERVSCVHTDQLL